MAVDGCGVEEDDMDEVWGASFFDRGIRLYKKFTLYGHLAGLIGAG